MCQVPSLLELLRIVQDPDAQPARKVWARGRIARLIQGRVTAMVRRRLGHTPEAEDVVQDTQIWIQQRLDRPYGTKNPDDRIGEAQCWRWVFDQTRSRLSDWFRRKKRRGEIKERVRSEGRAAVVMEPPVQRWSREASLALAWEAYVHFLESETPPEGPLAEARRRGAPMDLAYFRTCYVLWLRVRLEGRATWEIGVESGFEGSKKTVQNRVSQMVKRGAIAMSIGAAIAADEELDPAGREDLAELRRWLEVPLKRGKGRKGDA